MTIPVLSWLDSSPASRRKALEVIKLFEEKGTIDEIGIGSVRDALSDVLFPGTSVLYTRARYFFLVAWTYQHLEGKRIASSAVAKEARKLELGLIDALLEAEDHAGTIGRVARQRLKTLPSTIYWSGLGVWGIRLTEQSQDQYHRGLDRFYERLDHNGRDDDGNALDHQARSNWHEALSKPPANFPRCKLSFALTRKEAEYLRERLLSCCPGTLLAHLVDSCKPVEELEFVWEHPGSGGFPPAVKQQLEHARNFSEAIHGAALLYNLMLAERVQEERLSKGDEWAETYGEAFTEWVELMSERASAHARWDRAAFWSLVHEMNPRVPPPTRLFVDSWLDMALSGDAVGLRTSAKARRLVNDRERAIKGRLARLHNVEALRRWTGWAGAGRLTYRWYPEVARVTADIQRGLAGNA